MTEQEFAAPHPACKGDEIVGIWVTEQEANRVRVQKLLMQDVLSHQILAREPILRGPTSYRP